MSLTATARTTTLALAMVAVITGIALADTTTTAGTTATTLQTGVTQTMRSTSSRKPHAPLRLSTADTRVVVIQLSDGTLMGCLTRVVDGTAEAAARYSKDNGRTWTDPQTLLRLTGDPGAWSLPEALAAHDGEVHLFFLNTGGDAIPAAGEAERPLVGELVGHRLDIWYARSHRNRTTWQQPRMIWKGYTGALNSVIQLTTGRIVLPFSYMTSRTWAHRGEGLDALTFMGQFNCTAIYSDDAGMTWHSGSSLSVPVPDIVSAYGAVEPVILQLKDGRVWMLIRTQLGRFYESFSPDGATWSQPRPTAIISSDSPAGLVRLPDGRIVLLWNTCLRFPYAYGGRHVLHAAISDDEGRTWRGYREVARDPKRGEPPPPRGDFGTAYPFPTATKDGMVIYYTGQGEARELLMLLDPDWLLETSQKADVASAQDEWSIFGTRGVEFVAHPDKPRAKVLRICKTDADWPASAVWNFPAGREGRLRLRIMARPGFAGALIGITDHFSVPFDLEDRFHNLFNLEIGPDGRMLGRPALAPPRWHELLLEWSCAKRRCRVEVDGKLIGTLPLLRETTGPCYLRLRSTAEGVDTAGLLVDSAAVDLAPR